jgi:hypothetical protein
MPRVYCSSCGANFTEIAAGTVLSPDFRFMCKGCLPRDNRVRGFDVAHDPRLDWSRMPEGTTGRPRRGEFLPDGFQLDRKTPKPMKPGPEWSRSDAFLRELLADRTDDEKGKALVLLIGRWRQCKTFQELADETSLSVEDAHKALSALRREGNALWKKKRRATAKAERNRQLSLRAKELFARDLTVRQVAGILKCSVGLASELRRAS